MGCCLSDERKAIPGQFPAKPIKKNVGKLEKRDDKKKVE